MDRTLLQERLDEASRRRRLWAIAGADLVQGWRQTFPSGTMAFWLARLGGESNTLLRWRSHAGVRGGRVELVDVLTLIATLPPGVRSRVCQFELQRIEVNFEYAMAAYSAQRLAMLLAQRDTLAQLRRTHAP